MGALVQYYALLSIVFLALAVYNIIFFSTFKADICKTVESNPDGTVAQVPSKTTLTTIPLVIAISDIIIFFFILMGIVGIKCFSSMAPEKFGNLGWCMNCFGYWVRNFFGFIRMLHYILLLIILI